jgi:hypothetical protein
MAKRKQIDLPDAATKVLFVAVLWVDKHNNPSLYVEHPAPEMPFPLCRQAIVDGLAKLQPLGADRGKLVRGAPAVPSVEGSRGLQYAVTAEDGKKPS